MENNKEMSKSRINMIFPYKNAWEYIHEVEKTENANLEELWDEYLIKPYWDKITEWAPDNAYDFMQPKPIKDISTLKEQLEILDTIDFKEMTEEFISVTKSLENDDEDPITVAIYPLDNGNSIVKERQNGVLGAGVFGNIIININPLATDYKEWIPYVFAHEYHHAIWGYHWHVLKGGLKGSLLEHMINEGQADIFAKSLYPNLKPAWIHHYSKEEEKKAWSTIRSVLMSTGNSVIAKYFFGNKELDLPWCIGYYFGDAIVKSFLEKHSEVSLKELIEIHPEDIFEMSGF